MKRGRPSKKYEVQKLILEVLEDNMPMSINAICSQIFKLTKNRISWNTVQKYLQELVEFDKVIGLATPHSKLEGKEGLTVYTLKK